MTFDQVEQKRVEYGIAISRLCRRADVPDSTYHRRLKNLGVGGMREGTLAKLADAIVELVTEKAGDNAPVCE